MCMPPTGQHVGNFSRSWNRRSRKECPNCTTGMIELGLFVKHRDLVDVWRSENPQVVACTWHQPDASVSSRLDRFYAPRKFPRSRCSIISCPLSDHDAVVLPLQLPESFHVEKGLRRLNTEIVKEQKFKEQFVEKYRGWQSLQPAFHKTLVWWDEVKSLIKQFAIRYCVERAHQRRFKFHSLCNRARDGSSSSDLHAHLECFPMRNCTEPECVPESSLLRRTRSLFEGVHFEPTTLGARIYCPFWTDRLSTSLSVLALFQPFFPPWEQELAFPRVVCDVCFVQV
ncbi:hypothetical protein BSL78_08867 [Apostichopus japonicus]|uniref:Pol-like protein n=1 Tax=Stichopus japonicus TaxID=307972 RepID=A0A2G8L272_STIJA|nr:hypothetical protein BSL78_08867 [Apostichopus japonicus]